MPRSLVHHRRVGFAVYGLAGLAGELVFTGMRGRPRTSLWMLPVYGLAQPLFEPAHDALRARPLAVRAAAYAAGFSAVEYASGRILRRLDITGSQGRAAKPPNERSGLVVLPAGRPVAGW